MSFIEFKNVCKMYPGSKVNTVDDFNLNIEEKEFVAFVGPSGCGKSTTLRMIAGFEEITGGELYIDGKKVNEMAPRDRGIAMVFQNYALYPHMTVEKNIGYGLKNMKLPADEIKKKVDWAIKVLGLEEYRTRKPKNLSGGQRQRVALGRAIVKNQKLFLMDEPLSNLDAKLRVSMRTEISKLHRELGATTIWESWEGTLAQGGIASLNHYSKGAVCEWLFKTMCGIRVDGENHFTIVPKPGGQFTYAKAQYQSIYGNVESGWEKTQEGYRFAIHIPCNTTATVILPDDNCISITAGDFTVNLSCE